MAHIPNRSAGAVQVRYYITQTLVSKYDLDHAAAEETARAWRLGRGAELHDASLEYLQQLLGLEAGFCLSRAILTDRDEAWERSIVGRFFNWTLWLLTAWFVGYVTKIPFVKAETYTHFQLLHSCVAVGYGWLKPRRRYFILTLAVFNFCSYSYMVRSGNLSVHAPGWSLF